MKNILVTGARGFIGSNIVSVLTRDESNKVSYLNRKDNRDILHESLQKCDYILHLAGVNRPDSDLEFQESNVELTEYICNYLEKIELSFLKLLNSKILSLGSLMNIVACSPISPLNLMYGLTINDIFVCFNFNDNAFQSLQSNIIPKCRIGIFLSSTILVIILFFLLVTK